MAAQQPPPPQQQAEAHQLAQAGIVAVAVAPLVAQAFALLDPRDLKGSLPKVKLAIAAIVQKYGRISASLAVDYYRLERKHAGITAPLHVKAVAPAGLDQIGPSVDWAVGGLWGPLNVEPITHNGATLAPFADRLVAAQTNVAGITENLSLDPGRYTVIQSVAHDPQAKGWARVPEPGACYFCALLATRGAVYKSEATASFKTHDHCRCHVEPVFSAYEPSAQIREWQSLYNETTASYSGAAKVKAFRQALEGRAVTGGDSNTSARIAARKAEPKIAGRTHHEIEAELAALEANLPKLTNEKQRAYHRERIAQLKALLAKSVLV